MHIILLEILYVRAAGWTHVTLSQDLLPHKLYFAKECSATGR
jgi:hypothetical protein